MATFCILWYRRGQEVHEFFLFFFKFNSDSIFFYVDLVRWQRTKATLKKIFFSVRLKLLNKKDFETTLWARVGSIRGADTCTFLTPQMRNVAPNHIHNFWFWFEKLVRWQRTNYTNLHFNAKVQYVRTSVLLVCIIFFYKHCEYFVIIS